MLDNDSMRTSSLARFILGARSCFRYWRGLARFLIDQSLRGALEKPKAPWCPTISDSRVHRTMADMLEDLKQDRDVRRNLPVS